MSHSHLILLITGASGHLGRAIVLQLLARIPAARIAVSVRDVDKVADLAARGVRVRHGDFADAESLDHAFEGAEQLLLVSSNAAAYGGDTLGQHRAAIAAARAAGVKRVLYTSHMGASATSAFPPMRHHHATEQLLEDSGLAWTALRNGFYAQSGLALLGDALESGLLEAPADGKVSWTTHDDLAEAAAILATTPVRHEGPTPPLTGAEALDLGDLARIASELQQRPVRREVIADAELRARFDARGAPGRAADIVLGMYEASRAGEFATVDPTLETLLGRRPADVRALLAASLQT